MAIVPVEPRDEQAPMPAVRATAAAVSEGVDAEEDESKIQLKSTKETRMLCLVLTGKADKSKAPSISDQMVLTMVNKVAAIVTELLTNPKKSTVFFAQLKQTILANRCPRATKEKRMPSSPKRSWMFPRSMRMLNC